MDVYFNKNNSVKIQQEFFHLSSTILIGCFVLEFSQPSHAHKFHANAKYQLARTKAEPVCTMWRMSVSAVITNGGKPYAKRWALEQPEATIWPQVQVPRTSGQVGLCFPAATWHAYLSCEQPKELLALTVLCLIFFVLA